jgi:hypothetical protein
MVMQLFLFAYYYLSAQNFMAEQEEHLLKPFLICRNKDLKKPKFDLFY